MTTTGNTLLFPQYVGNSQTSQASPAVMLIGAILLGAVVFVNSFNFTLTGLNPGDQFSVHSTVILRLALCTGCGLYGLFHLSRTVNQLFHFPGAWSSIFCLWALVTVPFAVSVAYSAAACFALWCMILFAPAVLLQLGGRRVVLALLVGLLVYCIGSWILFFAWPELGTYSTDPTRLGNNANELGIQATWAIVMLLVLGAARCVRLGTLLLLLGFAAVTLYFTGTRMPMIAAAAVATFFLLRKANTPVVVMAGFILAIFATLAMLALSSGLLQVDTEVLAQKMSRSGEASEIYNFTGRTEIWSFAVEKLRESPWVGYGHGGSRYALASFSNHAYEANDLHHAHNLLLNVALCTGLVGGLLVVAMLLTQLWGLFRRPATFPDLAMVTVFFGGLTEPILFGPMPRAGTIIWLIALFWRQMGASLQEGATYINHGPLLMKPPNMQTTNSSNRTKTLHTTQE